MAALTTPLPNPSTPPPQQPEERSRPPLPVTLGIEESSLETQTWLGFADPVEGAGPLGEVEQAALTPNPGPPEAEPLSVQEDTPPQSPEAPALSEAPAEPGDAPAELSPADPEASPPVVAIAPQEDEPIDILDRPAEPVIPAKTGPTSEPSPPAAPPPASSPPPDPLGTGVGEKDSRQSDAAALREAVDIIPGRPGAAKGLRIDTVRPVWSTTTRLTARPKDAVVEIEFARDGSVAHARFLADKTTGYEDVDGPLLDAIYRWTASGEPLRALPVQEPPAGITIVVRVLFTE